MRERRVILKLDDEDIHGSGCDCGSCGITGKSFGVGFYWYYSKEGDEAFMRTYSSSESSALEEAREICGERGYIVIDAHY